MTKKAINEVQDYLTVNTVDGDKVYQIVNVELLLRKHPPEAVVSFLKELQKEYGKKLGRLMKEDKTNPCINELVIKRFRVRMAINTIRNYDNHMEAA